jgi:hypothetical protein
MAYRQWERLVGISVLVWGSLLLFIGLVAGLMWNRPGFRDPDISGPVEMAFTFMLFLLIPVGFAAFATVFMVNGRAQALARRRQD